MNYTTLVPTQIIKTETLNDDFILKYNLTLDSYYVYQIVAKMYQIDKNFEYKTYLDNFCNKKDENDDFRHGVIDAFCEIVKAGVKKIAFSHATNDEASFARDLVHSHACCKKYGISYYVEEELIQTSLFHNSGSKVIILYSHQEDIDDYLKLKEEMKNNKQPTKEDMVAYGKELGRLLSYSPSRIEAMIENYFA